ncbi:MAG: hypothetical protein KAR06_09790 [Deltaproteobacteria bacterium]|nr:hypothetical protein [Deltaproteobacteria bacterium]
MDKTPISESVKSIFLEALEGIGFNIQKRESFLKWRDQEVYLAQNSDMASVMFVQIIREDKDGNMIWGLSKEMYESFKELAEADEESGMVVVLLDGDNKGFALGIKDFDPIKEKAEVSEEGILQIPEAAVAKTGAGTAFDGMDGFIDRMKNA